MAKYVHVNGGYKEYKELPQKYEFSDGSHTGNFAEMPESIHKQESFYPLEEVKPTYDRRIERLELDEYTTLSDKVQKKFKKVSISLEELKNKKSRQIDKHAESLLSKSLFQHDGKTFTLSKESVASAVELHTMKGITGVFPSPFTWTDADGNEVVMSEAYFLTFASVLASKKMQIIVTQKTHLATMNALTDALQVFNYDFSSGWGNYVPHPDPNEVI